MLDGGSGGGGGGRGRAGICSGGGLVAGALLLFVLGAPLVALLLHRLETGVHFLALRHHLAIPL